MMFNPHHTHIIPTLMLVAAVALPVHPLATNSLYGDTETSVANIFQAGVWGDASTEPNPFDIVLNEFLPFPNGVAYDFDFGNDGSDMPQGEWVELYNKGTTPVDVLNWYITDASGGGGNTHSVIGPANTNTGGTIIPPGGWLVVYMNKPTLNNVADEIHLYTDNNVEVDFVAYEQPSDGCFKEPSPGETNPPDLPTGTPGNGNQADCNQAQVAPNKSYARIPDGTGAWIDPIPTPGEPNIAEEGDLPLEPVDTGGGESKPTPEPTLEVEVSDELVEITEGEPVEVEVSDEPLEVVEPVEEPVDEPAPPPEEGEPEPEPTPEPETEEAPEPEATNPVDPAEDDQ